MPQAGRRTTCFLVRLLLAVAVLCAHARAEQRTPSRFAPFLEALWPEAQARGITRKTFDAAFSGLTPDARVSATTRRQPEYNAPVGSYLNRMASPARIANAARKAADWSRTLDAVERQYGVDRWIIVAL